MRSARLLAATLIVLGWAGMAGAAPARAVEASFEGPTATARLGEPITFRTVLRSDQQPARIELLTRLPRDGSSSVQVATSSALGDGAYEANALAEGHVTPNTTFLYRFRAVFADGTIELGPEERATVVDDRFTWRTREGSLVRLHWYEGDDAFAERALAIGDEALTRASDLLGVAETEPVDFFIYAAEDAFRAALGPGTRENVGGQANASIRTLFGLIEPTDIGSDWVEVLITHELTHLVFDTAVDNPYHSPPRWLNEGVAVYQAEGYSPGDRIAVESAARTGDLIPLAGLGGLFPTAGERFSLAYAESASAVSYLIATHGQDQLVALIRSYADGVTDDEAFTRSTGADLAAFDAAWIAWLEGEIPVPFGPLPAPPGVIPPDWTAAESGVTAEPTVGTSGAGPAASEAPSPRAARQSSMAPATSGPPSSASPSDGPGMSLIMVETMIALVAVVGVVLLRRS